MLTSDELVGLMGAVAKDDQGAFERPYRATRAKLSGLVLRVLRQKAWLKRSLVRVRECPGS
jgi:RNA polymerase sigma-70 factor (ECF subfamily)